MSATGGYKWDDPYRTGMGATGMYDPNTMKGLIYKASRGDLAAKNHLKEAGFTDQWGNFAFAPDAIRQGDYDTAVNQWATNRNLKTQNVTQAAPWNNGWQTQPDAFDSAWNSFFGPAQSPQAQTVAGGPGANNPSGTNPQMANTSNAMTPGEGTPAVAGQNVGYGGYKYGNANPTMNKFGFNFAAPGAGANFGSYLYAVGYNPQQDTYRHMFDQGGAGHGHDENNWNRIYGWANDFARANGYGDIKDMSPDAWQKAANYAIGRLRTDMYHDDPSGRLWQQSGFAGADKYLAQGGAGGAGGGGSAGGNGTPNPTAPGQNPPVAGSANGTPPGVSDADWAKRIAIARDPDAQAMEFYKQIGLDPNDNGLFTATITDTTNPILRAWMQFNQINSTNPNDPTDIDTAVSRVGQLANLIRQPGGMGQIRQDFRSTMQDPRFAQTVRGMGDQDGINLLQTGIYGANVVGANDLISRAIANRFKRSLGPQGAFAQYRLNNITNPNYLRPRDWLLQSEYADLLNGL